MSASDLKVSRRWQRFRFSVNAMFLFFNKHIDVINNIACVVYLASCLKRMDRQMGWNTSFEIMHWSKDHESFIFKFLTLFRSGVMPLNLPKIKCLRFPFNGLSSPSANRPNFYTQGQETSTAGKFTLYPLMN